MRQQIKNKDGNSTSARSICNTGASSTAAYRAMLAEKKEIPE